jgi:preprotein translocase subunit SecG
MTIVLIGIHVLVCILLIIIILIQAGRGGGLVEGFSGMESMFGTKTNTFLTRSTSVLATIFFLTCLSLALLSVRQSRSLMQGIKPVEEKTAPKQENTAAEKTETKADEVKDKVETALPEAAKEKVAEQKIPATAVPKN